MVEHAAGRDDVDARVGERQPAAIGLDQRRGAGRARTTEHPCGQVDPDDRRRRCVIGARPTYPGGVPTGTATNVDDDLAVAARRRLAERRLDGQTSLAVMDLMIGRAAQAASALEGLVDAHPLREQLWQLWAVALVRSNRHSDALSALDRLRAKLSLEVGIDPSPAVANLRMAIVREDPALLGTGFAFRLARNLAVELGGVLSFGSATLTLRLPAADTVIMGQAQQQ